MKHLIVSITILFSVQLRANLTHLDNILDAQSIVESNNNTYAIGDRKYKYNYSVGKHQIRIKTANWIINNKRIIPSKVIRLTLQYINTKIGTKRLLYISFINRYIAKRYLLWLYYKSNKKWKCAIIAYNTGLNASIKIKNGSGLKYYKKISFYIRLNI